MMRRLFLLIALLATPSLCTAQGFRFDSQVSQQLSTNQISGTNNVLVIPSSAKIAFCTFPANAVPCTNLATTYTSITLSTPCSTSTQIVLTGTSTCVATPDSQQNWGVWIASGNYAYTITVGGSNFGPYVLTAGTSSSGAVTSVGLAAPHEVIVTGSPVTTAGTLTEAWATEPYNTVFAGPTQNSIAGTFDVFNAATSAGTQTTLPITVTPVGVHDLAVFIAQADPGVAPTVSVTGGPGSWTSLINAGGGIAATQLLTTNNPLTATANFNSAVNSTGMITLFKAVGTPVVAQFANASGSVSNGATTTFPGNTTPGNSLLVILLGGSTNGNVQAVITDSQGNTFTPITNVQTTTATGGSFTQTIAATFLASNLKGATHDVVTFNALFGLGFSGEFNVYEMSGLSPFVPVPTFRPLSNGDLTGTAAALVGSAPLVVGNCVQAVAGSGGGVAQLITASGPCGTSSGTLTATGAPVAGNLAKFSGATSLTNGDISGDCTTTGTLAITCTKSNGVTIPITKTGSAAGCSTSGASYAGCTTTITWSGGAFADTAYFAVCMGVTATNFPYIEGITSQLAASVTVETRNGTSNGAMVSSYATINCIGVHP